MTADIRAAGDEDAGGIGLLIRKTIRISNAGDYPPAVIARVAKNFSESAVRAMLLRRRVLVAVEAGAVVGTAGLDGDVVRSVFVEPSRQGAGVGRGLMAAIETLAREAGAPRLLVPASLTAQGFYARLGYEVVREETHGEERTIVMAKSLV